MAQLAHCPACHCEVALPEEMAAGETLNRLVQCPECDEVFAVRDAQPHEVKQVKLVELPPAKSDKQATPTEPASPATDDQPAPAKFSSATLASFLGNADTPEDGGDDATDSKLQSLSELQSLDDLIRRGPSTFDDLEPSAADNLAETIDLDAPVADVPRSRDADDSDMPSPVADRRRPTLDDLLSGLPTSGGRADDSGSYDAVEEADELEPADADEPIAEASQPEPLDSFGERWRDLDDVGEDQDAPVSSDAPSFDFHVGESAHDLEGSKSLRAAMGFAGDVPLEVEDAGEKPDFASIDTGHEPHEAPVLNFAATDTPRGVVAARKRSGMFAFARTMFGVVGGGVVGIVAGYLLLLWIFYFIGRTDEPLGLAQYYPDVVKPSTFREGAVAATPSTEVDNQQSDLAADSVGELERMDDTEVAPASFDTDAQAPDEPPPWNAVESQPTPSVMIAGAPSYTAADLQQLTTLAAEASEGLLAGSFDDAATRPVKGGSYAKIAQLADALTFGEGASDVSWKNQARQVFPPLFQTDQSRQEIALIANYWLHSGKRRHGGIFFCGMPDTGQQQGSVAEYHFTLPGGQQLTVLTPQAMADSTTAAPAVAVVGSVVDDPANRIEGYTGDASQVIWSADLFPLAE